MEPDFNLDELKKSWQDQNKVTRYKNDEIREILNRRSRSYVKYIVWISIGELLLFLLLNTFAILNHDNGEDYIAQLKKLGVVPSSGMLFNFHLFYNVFKFLGLLISVSFIWIFVSNYKRINVESNLKRFILQIMSFKKAVNRFILLNILLIVVFLMVVSILPIYYISSQNVVLESGEYAGFIVGMAVGTIVSIGLLVLYYRLVYGIIMRRLGKNLKQLEDIEQQKGSVD